jgi:RimJ/RimL family protein N-acetyltransferase
MDRIKLRALTTKDIEKTLSWNNQEDISDLYSGHPFPVNFEMEQMWYERILTSNFPISVFGIVYLENQCLIGITVLKDINMINRSAEFAIYIGDIEYRGMGLAYEATLGTMQFGFSKLGLNRIFLKVLEENDGAIKLYLKAGFKKEGLFRDSAYKNNYFKNEIIMAILKNEFAG